MKISSALNEKSVVHDPWRPWSGSELEVNPPFIDVESVTCGSSRIISAIDPHLLKDQTLRHCMHDKGLLIIKNVVLSDILDVSRHLCRIFDTDLRLYPQEQDGKLVLELTSRREPQGWLDAQPFHTDAGHFLCLLCMSSADAGGESLLVSALRLHDILAEEAPSVLQECFAPWKFHRKNRLGPCHYEWPIFRHDADFGLSCYYLPNTIRNTPTYTGVGLSQAQLDTLEKIEEVLERKELRWTYKLKKGDILILNNKKVLHARAGYFNSPDCERILLRTWINLPESELSHDAPRY